jgi:hypothetical protein
MNIGYDIKVVRAHNKSFHYLVKLPRMRTHSRIYPIRYIMSYFLKYINSSKVHVRIQGTRNRNILTVTFIKEE